MNITLVLFIAKSSAPLLTQLLLQFSDFYIVQTIKDTWRKGNNIGALFLHIKGVFPSIILEKLIHNMRCRGMPEEYTKWIRRKVIYHVTTINDNDYYAMPETIPRGMDKGCPLSAMAYLFYSTDLIEVVCRNEGRDCVGFVNDTVGLLSK